ncbi:MAG TPA: dienelactone hydrolase family protein [Phenylobacterium sp.]|nr:dienelactone hydrolase family protein [Phenylobacterium sp.]
MAEAQIEIPGEDGPLEAFVACPDLGEPCPPVLLLGPRAAPPAQVQRFARRLCAHRYYVLAPNWSRREPVDLREDAEAWFDHLADERRTDDARVAVLGFGEGADAALRLATWRAERVAAVAAFGGEGLGASAAADVAQRLNAVIRVGYPIGRPSARIGVLETALALAGIDFEVEIYEGEPDWTSLLDLLARTLWPSAAAVAVTRSGLGSTDGRPI